LPAFFVRAGSAEKEYEPIQSGLAVVFILDPDEAQPCAAGFGLAANRGRADDDLSMTAGTNRLCALVGAQPNNFCGDIHAVWPGHRVAARHELSDDPRLILITKRPPATGTGEDLQPMHRFGDSNTVARPTSSGSCLMLRHRSTANVSSIKRALVSGTAFRKSLQDEVKARGVQAYRASIRHRRPRHDRLRDAGARGRGRHEDLIMEITRPGTCDPVVPGDVGDSLPH